MNEESTTLAEDLLTGAVQIAAFVGVEPRRAFYLLERGHLPAFKIGAKWHARKSTLRAHFAKLDANGSTAE